MSSYSASNAMDHVVLVIFENRSFDNVLGHLYGPEDGKDFDGVVGKSLSNPIPQWAEHGAERGSVPYTVATDMDAPNPDSGEEYFHTNTQLYNNLDEQNRFKIGAEVSAPWNAPSAGQQPDMSGFVTDYISTFTAEMGRQPNYDEYSQIMTGYTPAQLPVLNGLARDFGVFDHWFSEVPSQTFMNRSFWTAAESSGLVINAPFTNFMTKNTAETLFERLEAHGKTWKVYVMEPDPISFTGLIHFARLKEQFADRFVPFSDFEADAAAGTLPHFALIEPNLLAGHGDYHPAMGRSFIPDDVNVPLDPPSSLLAGESFLDRLYRAYRAMTSEQGSNVWNTTLFVGWDEPGGTYDHVPPPDVTPPHPGSGPGQLGFEFDRSGYRVPAIAISPWVESGSVYNAEHRHTSLIATLCRLWDIGGPFTERDRQAAPIDYIFSRSEPRPPHEWSHPEALPVPDYHVDWADTNRRLSNLGKAALPALRIFAEQHDIDVPKLLLNPDHESAEGTWALFEVVAAHVFPKLGQGPERIAEIKASFAG